MSRGMGYGKSAFALESLEGRRLLSASSVLEGINPGGPMIAASPVVQPTATAVNPGGPIIVANKIKTQGELIHPVVDAEFDGKLGTVTGVSGLASDLSNLHGSINWGDGHTTSATFIDNNGTIEVDGSHEYGKTGQFHINVTLTRTAIATPGKPTPQYVMLLGSIFSTAQVRQNSTGGLTINEKAGKSFTTDVGAFSYTGLRSIVATIDWGDDKTSTGTLTKGKDGEYTVTGTHTYKSKGTYHIHIQVTTKPIIIDPIGPVVPAKVPAILVIAQIDSTADVT